MVAVRLRQRDEERYTKSRFVPRRSRNSFFGQSGEKVGGQLCRAISASCIQRTKLDYHPPCFPFEKMAASAYRQLEIIFIGAPLFRGGLPRFAIIAVSICTLLAGCATYSPQPLSVAPDLTIPPRLTVNPDRFACPPRSTHPFDANSGLDMTDVAILAVLRNPDLNALREKAGVARAQLFSARLLPDPQVTARLDYPTVNRPDLFTAYEFGLNYDLNYFVTRKAGVKEAAAGVNKVDLDILWQEWQVVQKARTLFVQCVFEEDKLAVLKQIQRLYSRRYARSSKALREGNLTLDVTGTDLTAKIDSDTKVRDMEEILNKTRHDLNAILGILPEAKIRLVRPPGRPNTFDEGHLKQAVAGMADRRPDLVALRAGYESQEARVHKAVLGQFPALNVGVVLSSDNTDVHSIGHQTTLTLPFFNRNRGKIAVEKATRQQLRKEYQARIDKAYGEADLVWTRQRILMKQLSQLHTDLPTLENMVGKARRAYADQNIAPLIYLNMENTLANKNLKSIDLTQGLWESAIALDTLLARPPTP
jgi:cobalt-zinc-cadmium efflux system outer membrane protein